MATNVTKQDSNFTGLRYAVESTPGVLPGSPAWIPLEPNDYKDFGGDVKTVARNPINPSRQRKKGNVVDLDAKGGFSTDVTGTNLQDLMQSYLFAALRTKSELAVAVVDNAGHQYEPASGGTSYQAGDLLWAKGSSHSANNGLKKVSGTPDATHVVVTDTNVVSETGASLIISRVGYEFGSGTVSITNGGTSFPTFDVANVAAHQTLVSSANYADGETVTIGLKVYTFQASLTNVDGHVKIGASEAASIANLHHAINGVGGTIGTDYATATVANTDVTATDDASHTVTVTARITGASGNSIVTTETSATAAWTAVTLAGGVGRDLTTLGLIPGEWVFVGDDASNTSFSVQPTNNGFARIRSIAGSELVFDKTQFETVTDAGSAKSIRLLFGRVLKNESDQSLIVSRTVQLERTLGAPDSGSPSQIQAEYLVNALPDQGVLDMKTGKNIGFQTSFLAGTYETRAGTLGVKSGTRPSIVESDCFNATSDVSRIAMSIVSPTDGAPTPLFAFLTDLSITIKNNIQQNKAVGVLGSFSTTAGTFEVMASVTAYFADVAAVAAVQANDSITLDVHLVKAGVGLTVDLPLVALAKALVDVKQDKPVTLPLTADAATAKLIDTNLDHTMLMVFWDYLPLIAE